MYPQQSVEFSCGQIGGGDEAAGLGNTAIGELTNENVMAEPFRNPAEPKPRPTGRSANHRVRDAARGGLRNYKCPEAQARTVRPFQRPNFLVERIGDNNVVADILHVERHEVGKQRLIYERISREGP